MRTSATSAQNPAGIVLNAMGDAMKPISPDWRRLAGGPWSKETTSGAIVDEDTVMSLDSVMACARVISESIASLPLEMYEYDEVTDELTLARDHRLYDLLRWAPNDETTSYEMRYEMLLDACVRGFGAAQVIYTAKGEVYELWPLEARFLTAFRDPQGVLFYLYSRWGGNKKRQILRLEANEVLIVKMLPRGGLLGTCMTRVAVNTFGAVKSADDFAAEFFENGSIHTGTIEVPIELTDKAYKRLKADWKDQHTGKGNRHRAPILEGGAKFTALSLTNQEAQLLETMKFKRSVIAGLFRVPAHLINDLEKATFSNIEHLDIGFVKHCLRPWLTNFEQRLQLTLLNLGERRRFRFEHDLTDLLRGDFPTRMEGYGKAITNGIMNANEVRRKEKMNPYADGEKYYVQGALRPTNEPYQAKTGKDASAQNQPKLDSESKALLLSFHEGLKLIHGETLDAEAKGVLAAFRRGLELLAA